MNICLDFDGVLHAVGTQPPGGRLGRPVEGARQACWDMHYAGHKLYVHTSRIQREDDTQWLHDWLMFWDFPFMHIAPFKPRCELYVDDHGLAFEGWGNSTTWPEGTWRHG